MAQALRDGSLTVLSDSQRRALAGVAAMTLARGPTGGSVSAHFVRGFFLDLCTVKLNLPTDAVGGLEPLLEQQLSDSGSASTAQDATACPFLDGVPSDMKTRELIVADLVGLYAAHAEYDARVRHALRLVASALQVPVRVRDEAEDAAIIAIAAQAAGTTAAAHHVGDTTSVGAAAAATHPKSTAARWLKVGAAALGGGALLVLTGGLAAPALIAGAGIVASAIGLGAAATAVGAVLSTAAGGAVLLSLLGGYGSGLATHRMARRMGGLSVFHFVPITPHIPPNESVLMSDAHEEGATTSQAAVPPNAAPPNAAPPNAAPPRRRMWPLQRSRRRAPVDASASSSPPVSGMTVIICIAGLVTRPGEVDFVAPWRAEVTSTGRKAMSTGRKATLTATTAGELLSTPATTRQSFAHVSDSPVQLSDVQGRSRHTSPPPDSPSARAAPTYGPAVVTDVDTEADSLSSTALGGTAPATAAVHVVELVGDNDELMCSDDGDSGRAAAVLALHRDAVDEQDVSQPEHSGEADVGDSGKLAVCGMTVSVSVPGVSSSEVNTTEAGGSRTGAADSGHATEERLNDDAYGSSTGGDATSTPDVDRHLAVAIPATPDVVKQSVAPEIPPYVKPKETVDWLRDLIPDGEAYALVFEPDAMRALGISVSAFVQRYISNQALSYALQQTLMAPLLAAWALPSTALNALSFIDSPWAVAIDRADKAGVALAEALLTGAAGSRPVTLVAFGIGARVVWRAALELAKRGEAEAAQFEAAANPADPSVAEVTAALAPETESLDDPRAFCAAPSPRASAFRRSPFGILADVVVLGAPVTGEPSVWKTIRAVVAGRLINCYSRSDVVLRYAYRSYAMSWVVAGAGPIGFSVSPGATANATSPSVATTPNDSTRANGVLDESFSSSTTCEHTTSGSGAQLSHRTDTRASAFADDILPKSAWYACDGVESVDVSTLVSGHLEYGHHLRRVLGALRVEL